MSSVRKLFGITVLVLLVGGYLASVLTALTGSAAEYAAKIDTPPVRMLALVLFVGALVLAVCPVAREDGQ